MEEVGVVGGRLSALDLNIGRFGTHQPTQLDIGPEDFSHLAYKNLLDNAASYK